MRNCTVPEKMLLTINDLDAYLDTLNPDLIVLQNITFANAAYASEVLKRFACPIVLWTLREPVIDGTRLRLNSLTGAYSAGNAITAFRGEGKFEYIFGAPGEAEVEREVGAAIRAAKVKYDLRRLKMISIGHTPQGFGFGRALDAEMMSTFGTTLDSIEARELINKAKGYTEEELADELAEARKTIVGLEAIPENNVVNFARLYKAYKSYVGENHIGALCSRCWPDFFTEFGTPVCSVLSLLNANGVSASCESDAYGALSMFIGSDLTSRSCFFGDPVSMNEKEGTITFWHCGMAACDLARKDTGAQVVSTPTARSAPLWTLAVRPVSMSPSSVWAASRTAVSASSSRRVPHWTSPSSSTAPPWSSRPWKAPRMSSMAPSRAAGSPTLWWCTARWPTSWKSWATCWAWKSANSEILKQQIIALK